MSWSRFFRRTRWDAERAEELEAYIEAETADNIARGMTAAEARAAAHRKLGNPTLSFSVARRTGEIGTRIALGASRPAVLALILKQGISLVLVGLILGLAGAFAVTRSLVTLLYGVRSTDPLSYMGVSALLLAVGLLASYLPARSATKVDPMVALREE